MQISTNQFGQTIVTVRDTAYLQREFVDVRGRKRVCTKRLDTLPKPHNDVCLCCGQPIDSERSTKKFCSAGCRVKWNRQQKKAA